MNPTKLALITKHGKKFVTKSESVTDGVHYAADGSAIMTDRHRLLRIKDIHANTEPSTRCLTTGRLFDGAYPDTSRLFPSDVTKHIAISDTALPELIAVTKAIVSVARALGDRMPIVTIIDGVLTYKHATDSAEIRANIQLNAEHPSVAVNAAYLTDALAVFKDAGSAEISVFVSGQASPIVLYDDKVGVDMIVLPVRTQGGVNEDYDPFGGYTDEQHEESMAAWLFRRIDVTKNVYVIMLYVSMFRQMWAEKFGNNCPIPLYVQDHVMDRARQVHKGEEAE